MAMQMSNRIIKLIYLLPNGVVTEEAANFSHRHGPR